MKTTNIPAGSQRLSNVGLVWQEVITNGAGTFRANFQSTIRVRAIAQTTVTIDGVLAITLEVGETEYVNVGTGLGGDGLSTIEVVIAGTANVQIAKDIESGRRSR